jgi:hypothetical protein
VIPLHGVVHDAQDTSPRFLAKGVLDAAKAALAPQARNYASHAKRDVKRAPLAVEPSAMRDRPRNPRPSLTPPSALGRQRKGELTGGALHDLWHISFSQETSSMS